MSSPYLRDPLSTDTQLLFARGNLKLSREQLAEKICYTASYIEKMETGKLAATESYITAAAKTLAGGIDATQLFGRLRQDERRVVVPSWFRPWVDHEQEATEIRYFEPLVVPGLFQTEAYALALLGDAERVAFRLERQRVLERVSVTIIVAESVLNYLVGSVEVMHHQLRVGGLTSDGAGAAERCRYPPRHPGLVRPRDRRRLGGGVRGQSRTRVGDG